MNQSSKPLSCRSESDLCTYNLGVNPEVHMTLGCCFFKALLCGCSGPPYLDFWLASGALTSSLYYVLSTSGSARKDREDTERRKNATGWTIEEVGKITILPRVLAQRPTTMLRLSRPPLLQGKKTMENIHTKRGASPFSLSCRGLLPILQIKTKESFSRGLSFCISCALWGLGGHQRIKVADKSLSLQWYSELPNPRAGVYFSEITDSCTRHVIQLYSVSAHSVLRTRASHREINLHLPDD